MRKLLKSKKALSPVVAAIILIAVTVAVSIAVAAWMGSMTFTFMETEELRLTTVDFTDSGIVVYFQNTGSTDMVITTAVVNGQTISNSLSESVLAGATGDTTINAATVAGSSYTIELISSKGNKFAYTAISDTTYTPS
jgi:flagellin-like protein